MLGAAVKGSLREFSRDLQAMAREIDKGKARALNRAGTHAVAKSAALISSETTLKSSYIKGKLKLMQRAVARDLQAVMRSQKEGVGLLAFKGVRQTKKGITYQPDLTKPRILIRGGFKSPRRITKAGRVPLRREIARPSGGQRWKDIKYPLTYLRGPPLSTFFAGRLDRIAEDAYQFLMQRLDHELDFALGRIK